MKKSKWNKAFPEVPEGFHSRVNLVLSNLPERGLENMKHKNSSENKSYNKTHNKSRYEKKRKHNKIVKNYFNPASKIALAAAASLIVGLLFCVSNPVLAAKLPFIGNIFQKLESVVDYKGDYSTNAEHLLEEDLQTKQNEVSTQETEIPKIESSYIKESNGITVSISEASYGSKALYLAMRVENAEGFPDDFNMVENREGYILDHDRLYLNSTAVIEFNGNSIEFCPEKGFPVPYYIEGLFENKNTFVGIIRVDLSWLPETAGTERLPDEFLYRLHISEFRGELFETEEEKYTDPETGEELTIPNHIEKKYPGSWEFELNVAIDPSDTQVVPVEDTNAEGWGIKKVEKTPYEIVTQVIVPAGREMDYFLVICDANGDLLDIQGDNAEVYSVYGRDTSTVSIYLCDYIRYMDELKGYYWSKDYEVKRTTKTFAQYLDENAIYGTKVEFLH